MIKDYREIREVVMQYVNGCAAGDVELAKKAFHKDAVMYGYLNGELSAGSIENLYAAIGQLGADAGTKWTSWKRSARLRRCVSCWRTGMGCRSPIFIRW